MNEVQPRILCVDDEQSILMSLNRLFRLKNYDLSLSSSGAEALKLLQERTFDLIISDMRMPGMDGATFLAQAAELYPDTRRILLTGYSDQDATIRAINNGKISQYVNKPWNNDELCHIVEQELQWKQRSDQHVEMAHALEEENHQLHGQVEQINAELQTTSTFLDMAKDQLQQSYLASIKTFANLINMRIGLTHRTMDRIVQDVEHLCESFGIQPHSDIQHAARLCQLGKIGFSDELLALDPNDRTPEQDDLYQSYPELGEAALLPMAGLSHVRKIIRHQNENYDGSGMPDQLMGNDIPLTARILRVVADYHTMMSQNRFSQIQARDYLTSHIQSVYDPRVVKQFLKLQVEQAPERANQHAYYALSVVSLKAGMQVYEDIYAINGMLLLSKGTVLQDQLINRLMKIQAVLHEPLIVKVKKEYHKAADIGGDHTH